MSRTPAPRRRRGCLVTAVIAVVLLVGGAVLADRVAHGLAQQAAADAVRQRLDSSGEVAVDIRGFPFLTQLASGTLDDVRLRADAAQLESLSLTDVDVTAADVRIQEPRSARDVVATGTVPTSVLQDTLRDASGWDLTLTTQGSDLVASGEVLSIPVSVSIAMGADPATGLTATITGAQLGGLTVDAAALPDGLGVRLTDVGGLTDRLPAGASITDARVRSDGLRVTVHLTDVTEDSL